MSSFNTSVNDITELENILNMNTPVKTSVKSRWERKQQQQQNEPSSTKKKSDRFIPDRSSINMDMSSYSLSNDHNEIEGSSSSSSFRHDSSVESTLLSNNSQDCRILAFKEKPPVPKEEFQSSVKVLYSEGDKKSSSSSSSSSSFHQYIPSAPFRMLDAPDFMDDYYLNLLSWSSQNVLAVALNQTVYLWEAATGNIAELLTLEGEDDYVSSLSWIQEGGAHLAIGTAGGKSELWDVNEGRRLRSMNGHDARVSSMDWNGHILSTGGRDSQIIHHDVRVRDHVVGSWVGHEQEVCGLKWSPDGTMLASGSNDNTLCLWDWGTKGEGSFESSRSSLLWKKTDHLAAVKALAWSPHERRVLASGGGTADRTIKIWNCATGAMTSSTDTGSQVCSLLWSPFEKELLSSHGFSDYQLSLWKYPTMTKIKDFTSHTARVLHMAVSPDGSSVVSLSADETLRFWDIFAASSSAKQSRRKGRSTVSSDLQNPVKSKGGVMAPSTSAPGMSKKKHQHHHSHSTSGSFNEDGGRLARPIHIR